MGPLNKILIAGLMFLGVAVARADQPDALFKQAGDAYSKGQFSQAVTLYESAQSGGLNHWALYYNLGNAYFKSGVLGKAVVNYLRAFRLNSHQHDVVFNLNLALTKAGDPLVPQEALARLFWWAFYSLSLNLLTALTSLLFIGTCFSAGLVFLGRWRSSAEPAVFAIGLLVVLTAWWGIRVSLTEKNQGVVVSGTAEVRGAPNLSEPANFTVPEGRRVLILEEQEPIKGWLEIGVPQEGLKGWVPDTSVEAV